MSEKNHQKLLKIFVLIILLSTIACSDKSSYEGSSWVKVGEGSYGNVWYYDSTQVTHVGDKTRAWVKIMLTEGDVSYTLGQYEFDCAGYRMRSLEGKVFYKDDRIEAIPAQEWRGIPPDSLLYKTANKVCP